MKRTVTQQDEVRPKIPRKKAGSWNQVFNDRKQRVRGLWERNGVFYAQIRVGGKPFRLRLEHAKTVAEAFAEMQVLKKNARDGVLHPPEKVGQNVGQTIKALSAVYLEHATALGDKDPDTIKREQSSLHAWQKFRGDLAISKINDPLLLEFAKWRKTKAGGEVSGRCIDLDVRALRHSLKRAVELGWLKEVPIHKWKRLAKKPEKTRLIAPEELDRLCQAAMPDPKILQFIPPEHRSCGQVFADYLRLMAYSGGREQETIQQRWSNVKWSKGDEKGSLCYPAETAKKGGGSQEAGEPRYVDFNKRLETLLTTMFARKDPESDWIFPNQQLGGPMKNFRRQLRRVKKATGMVNFGFHHLRHFFISHCVMAGIDYATIALWVGHRDGGVLIGKVYGHLSREHPQRMAAKLDTAF